MHRLIRARILRWLAAAMLALAELAVAADPAKVLRVASPDIETLDPHQYNDSPSFDIVVAIFEGLYEWDYLASPARLAPVGAAALPAVAEGGRVWTIRVRAGVLFTDDPAFGGRTREAIAEDYVYSMKRWLDPNLRRGGAPIVTDLIVGARAAVDAARKPGAKFDYDRPIAGLRALDRYTLQLTLTEPNFANIEEFLTTRVVAREVVEAAGGDIRARPVGTGPFRLKEWKRGSRIVLDANPAYRAVRFPDSSDPSHAALVRGMRGRTLPQIGAVEIAVIDEDLTRLLEFDRGRLDYVILRGEIANRQLAGGKVKPEYAARGITHHADPEPYLFSVYCNIADPVIGGMGNDRVALRRALALAFDAQTLARVVYAGQAVPANQLVPPRVTGHDPSLPPRLSPEPAAANALLDRVGYGTRDADGYRRAPDGRALTLTVLLRSGAISREIQTLWKKDMDAIGVRTEFRVMPFQDAIKELEAGKFQLYFGGYGGVPSGYAELMQLSGKQPPSVNPSRFSFADYDRAMEAFLRSPGPDGQIAAARRMSDIARTYAPMFPVVFRVASMFVQPWVEGFAPPTFQTYWKYLDLDPARRARMEAR